MILDAARAAWLVPFGAILAAACCPRPWPKTLEPLPSPVQVLTAAAEGRQRLRSFSSDVTADTFTREGRVKARKSVVVADRSGRLRIEAVVPPVGTIATLVSDGHRFALYDLRKKRFYQGPATPSNLARLLPIRLRGQEIAQLLFGEPPLVAPAPKSMKLDRCRSHYTLELEDIARGARQTVSVDAVTLVPVRTELRVGDKLAYRVTFAEHRRVRGVLIPHKVRYEAPGDEVDLLLTHEDVVLDETFEDASFRLDPPTGAEIVPVD